MVDMTEEIRVGAKVQLVQHLEMTQEQCLSAVDKLNGMDCTLISISQDDMQMMIVGGAGEYVVTAENDQEIRNLIDSSKDEDDFAELTVGGQACEYPMTYVVDKELVKTAIMDIFFGAVSQLEWEITEK